MMGVAIIIPMLNEAAALSRWLRYLAVLDPALAEILALDSSSMDGYVAIVRTTGLRVLEPPIQGRPAQINRGV